MPVRRQRRAADEVSETRSLYEIRTAHVHAGSPGGRKALGGQSFLWTPSQAGAFPVCLH